MNRARIERGGGGAKGKREKREKEKFRAAKIGRFRERGILPSRDKSLSRLIIRALIKRRANNRLRRPSRRISYLSSARETIR